MDRILRAIWGEPTIDYVRPGLSVAGPEVTQASDVTEEKSEREYVRYEEIQKVNNEIMSEYQQIRATDAKIFKIRESTQEMRKELSEKVDDIRQITAESKLLEEDMKRNEEMITNEETAEKMGREKLEGLRSELVEKKNNCMLNPEDQSPTQMESLTNDGNEKALQVKEQTPTEGAIEHEFEKSDKQLPDDQQIYLKEGMCVARLQEEIVDQEKNMAERQKLISNCRTSVNKLKLEQTAQKEAAAKCRSRIAKIREEIRQKDFKLVIFLNMRDPVWCRLTDRCNNHIQTLNKAVQEFPEIHMRVHEMSLYDCRLKYGFSHCSNKLNELQEYKEICEQVLSREESLAAKI